MKLELTPWTVFLGILLFCKELTYTVCLRLILVGYVSINSLVIFPLCAGWLLNLLVFTIPLSYLIYAAPAFVLAIALSSFMIIFNRLVLNKKRSFIFFSILIAPCIVLSDINFYELSTKQPWVLHFIELFFSSKADETTIPSGVSLLFDGIILLAIVLGIAGYLIGGGLVAGILSERLVKTLLAPPRSVRKQLLAYIDS
ncbi:hypothetical protein AAV96_13925 [Acinetobacter sp. AG1]|uniref:hypothetical protein n=1 Tax=Acinetobacter TaxID=469 RepID=UPI00062995B9|nr:hypothetical protein [Acinetobacter sp. AG1]KKW76644.1 hypothetical protein AAV96_13925 [Acinetobacter sp. AG1]